MNIKIKLPVILKNVYYSSSVKRLTTQLVLIHSLSTTYDLRRRGDFHAQITENVF